MLSHSYAELYTLTLRTSLLSCLLQPDRTYAIMAKKGKDKAPPAPKPRSAHGQSTRTLRSFKASQPLHSSSAAVDSGSEDDVLNALLGEAKVKPSGAGSGDFHSRRPASTITKSTRPSATTGNENIVVSSGSVNHTAETDHPVNRFVASSSTIAIFPSCHTKAHSLQT